MRPAPSPPRATRARRRLALLGRAFLAALGFIFEIDRRRVVGIDPLLENGRRLENHHPARRYRNFLAGLRISANPLTFLANHEGAKGGQLHGLASFKAVRD